MRRLFDVGADIETIGEHLSGDPALAPLVAERPGLRAPGGWDGFEIAMRAVLGQQISVMAARKLGGQLVALHGRAVPKSFRIHPDLSHVFPTAKRLTMASWIGLGMPAARSATLKAVAEATLRDPNLFRPFGNIEETVARLRTVRGIGEWTAQYIALRAIRELYPSREASWRVPCLLFVGMGGMAFGGWFAGALYDHFGFYAPAFASGVLFNLFNLALVGFLVLRQRWNGGFRPALA